MTETEWQPHWRYVRQLEQERDAGTGAVLRAVAPHVPFRHPVSAWPMLLLLTAAGVYDHRGLRRELARDLARRETPTSVLRFLVATSESGKGPAWQAAVLRSEIRPRHVDVDCGQDGQRVFQVDASRIRRVE